MVVSANICDSSSIAKLHFTTIRSGFLSRLGIPFLESLYKYLIENEIVFTYISNGQIGGFICCALNSDKLIKRFLLKSPEGVLRILTAILYRPILLLPTLETGLNLLGFKKNRVKKIELPRTELLSVSVSTELQNKRIGKALLDVLEDRLIELGVSKYKVVAGARLEGANMFYLKNGFMLISTMKIHGNEISNIYCKTIR